MNRIFISMTLAPRQFLLITFEKKLIIDNGKWKMENGKWKMENGEWRI